MRLLCNGAEFIVDSILKLQDAIKMDHDVQAMFLAQLKTNPSHVASYVCEVQDAVALVKLYPHESNFIFDELFKLEVMLAKLKVHAVDLDFVVGVVKEFPLYQDYIFQLTFENPDIFKILVPSIHILGAAMTAFKKYDFIKFILDNDNFNRLVCNSHNLWYAVKLFPELEGYFYSITLNDPDKLLLFITSMESFDSISSVFYKRRDELILNVLRNKSFVSRLNMSNVKDLVDKFPTYRDCIYSATLEEYEIFKNIITSIFILSSAVKLYPEKSKSLRKLFVAPENLKRLVSSGYELAEAIQIFPELKGYLFSVTIANVKESHHYIYNSEELNRFAKIFSKEQGVLMLNLALRNDEFCQKLTASELLSLTENFPEQREFIFEHTLAKQNVFHAMVKSVNSLKFISARIFPDYPCFQVDSVEDAAKKTHEAGKLIATTRAVFSCFLLRKILNQQVKAGGIPAFPLDILCNIFYFALPYPKKEAAKFRVAFNLSRNSGRFFNDKPLLVAKLTGDDTGLRMIKK